MTDYLPKDATSEQACDWLQAKTGQTWILPRLLECHLTPYFWLDYKPGYPAIYSDRFEGYQTRMMFQGDLCRLESDGNTALVTMFAAHDGSPVKIEPGLRVPLSELRFKRDEIKATAEIVNSTAPAKDTPAPVAASEAPAQRAKRRSWLDVTGVYITEILRAGQYANGKALFNALESKAGTGSPFDKGVGANRGSLFVRELSQTLTMKTVQNNWEKLLKTAAKN